MLFRSRGDQPVPAAFAWTGVPILFERTGYVLRPGSDAARPVYGRIAPPQQAPDPAIAKPATLRRQGLLDPVAVTRVLDQHVSGRADLSRQLWGLLALTLWFERHVEGVRRDASLSGMISFQPA